MTVIAYRDGIMAADTGGWFGDICATTNERKVCRLTSGALVAASGRMPEIDLFHRWLENGAWNGAAAPFAVDEQEFGALLVDPDGTIYHYDHEVRAYQSTAGFAVEGCHQEFMLALMLAGYSAIDCVAMAIKHCSHASGEVYSLKLGEMDDRG